MSGRRVLLAAIAAAIVAPRDALALPAQAQCASYSAYSKNRNEPFSEGAYRLSSARPPPHCRTFESTAVEDAISRLKDQIYDPDLFRLFENTFPNTLDTAIKWRGFAEGSQDEELCFVITGDIDAMWIRDSANQIAPYKYVLESKDDDVASVFRGVINLQARYLIASPYCNAFHPPKESGIEVHGYMGGYTVTPSYDPNVVFTCNFELDDFGGFLQLSHDYYNKTQDLEFFGKFSWIKAIQSIMDASKALQRATYDDEGNWVHPVYTFSSLTRSSAGTLANNGFNSPINYTGMLRAPFRPSDDAAIFDFGIAANMMMARYLIPTAEIMSKLPNAPPTLAEDMLRLAEQISNGIEQFGVVQGPGGERIYAYEVDGFGGRNLMDDANVPSLLSAPFLGFVDRNDPIYQATRKFVWSRRNPWFCQGPVITGIGSGHIQPGATWPMSNIMHIMTSDDDDEIVRSIREILRSTDGLGLIHESVHSHKAIQWTREWFTWANGLFGQMIMDLAERKPHLLKKSYQPGPMSDA